MAVNKINNWISGNEAVPIGENYFDKMNPHTGKLDSSYADSTQEDVNQAIESAAQAFQDWSARTPVERGKILGTWARAMRDEHAALAAIVAGETGKPPGDAEGEVGGAIALAEYFAGEGMRLHGRSLTSGMPGKYSHTVRQAMGVAALIVPANTPIANIAWKIFPALICGNTAVLKASEDAPQTALKLAQIATHAGLPAGVFNVLQGKGASTGQLLVEDARIPVVSFTGSTETGRWIAETCGRRLAKLSLELGGKNPFVVCDDADLDAAVHWASLSAFSNAGQRCASGSRLIVFDSIYDAFIEKLVVRANSLKLGIESLSDLGPVINARQHQQILDSIKLAVEQGGHVLCGGGIPDHASLQSGYYIQPTLIAGLKSDADLCHKEIFGPVASVQRVSNIKEALTLALDTEYGLTATIHTKDVDRAMWFAQKMNSGLVNINIGTYGSEPHMPFGGTGASGNGSREPGVEALDVYSELKNISFLVRDQLI